MLLGKTRQELLRALPDESPAQMAEDQYPIAIGLAALGGLNARINCAGRRRFTGQAGHRIGHATRSAQRGSAVAFAVPIPISIAITGIISCDGGGRIDRNHWLNPLTDRRK